VCFVAFAALIEHVGALYMLMTRTVCLEGEMMCRRRRSESMSGQKLVLIKWVDHDGYLFIDET
jgi:hypothetical protein